MRSVRELLTPIISKRRDYSFVRLAARAARGFLLAYENHNYYPRSNGEEELLRRLAPSHPHVVFDAGANIGDWTVLSLKYFSDASIHCFEIVPATGHSLKNRLGDNPRVTVNLFGLLDVTGSLNVKIFPGADTASSVLDFPHEREHGWVKADVRTGDSYCADSVIPRIDLLKIDTEGSEPQVLKGFAGMLERGAISVIQFEYGLTSVLNHFLLYDFYEFFDRNEYSVGKLYPDGVEFRPYDLWRDESFIGSNFVAVHRACQHQIDLVKSK